MIEKEAKIALALPVFGKRQRFRNWTVLPQCVYCVNWVALEVLSFQETQSFIKATTRTVCEASLNGFIEDASTLHNVLRSLLGKHSIYSLIVLTSLFSSVLVKVISLNPYA